MDDPVPNQGSEFDWNSKGIWNSGWKVQLRIVHSALIMYVPDWNSSHTVVN